MLPWQLPLHEASAASPDSSCGVAASLMMGCVLCSVPNVHEGLCSSKLLVMQWIEGCKVTDKDCLKDHGINPRSVALSLVDAFSEMTLVHGFVHGDPHPGNVIVKPLDR